jgi:hypothetical protein
MDDSVKSYSKRWGVTLKKNTVNLDSSGYITHNSFTSWVKS